MREASVCCYICMCGRQESGSANINQTAFFFAFKGNLGTLGSSSVGKKKSMTSERED